jgi:hypothetical protein
VVEMTMLAGVELDLAIVVEAGGEASIGMDGLDSGQFAIGDAERFIGCGELDAVANRELTVDLAVDADAGQAAGIIGGKFSVSFLDCKLVGGWVDRYDRSVTGSFDSDGFAAAGVANYVVDFVVAGP